MNAIEDWLLNQFAGKVVARAAVTIAGFVAGAQAQYWLTKFGIHATIDPAELSAGMIAAFHAGFEAYKAWRLKSAVAPAVPFPNAPQP